VTFVTYPEPSLLIAGITHSNLVQKDSIMKVLLSKFGNPFYFR